MTRINMKYGIKSFNHSDIKIGDFFMLNGDTLCLKISKTQYYCLVDKSINEVTFKISCHKVDRVDITIYG